MKFRKILALLAAAAIVVGMFAGCGADKKTEDTSSEKSAMTDEERIKAAAAEGKVGNWGLGNEYEIQALLTKYGLSTDYLVQSFDMDGFDDGSITLASAMTYNELGLVVNSYEGGYNYGDSVGIIDMNDQGVAMLEDNIFCTKEFAEKNPNTVKAFLSASLKGWEYACANPDEAAQIVFEAGSSVSSDHQKYMASEVAKLVKTDTQGNAVSEYGKMDEEAMQQTLDLAKKYIKLDDSAASEKLKSLTLDDIRDTSYFEAAK
ncbi:MAG: ABC transporter substrate-binding protein, partial [Oscillospiraceae bacterium]|nr:ABC transporter substrate-binding protein [Oscillospiraceae bacterium]